MSEATASSHASRLDVWTLQKYALLVSGVLSAVYAGYAYVTKLNTVHIQSSCVAKRDLQPRDVATEHAVLNYRYRLARGFRIEPPAAPSSSVQAGSGQKSALQDALSTEGQRASRSPHMLYCELTNVGQKPASDLELQMSEGGLFSASLNETIVIRSPQTSEGIKLGTLLPRVPYQLTAYYLAPSIHDIALDPGNRVALTYSGGIAQLRFAQPAVGWAATLAPVIEFIEALAPYSLIMLALCFIFVFLTTSVLLAPYLRLSVERERSAPPAPGDAAPHRKQWMD